MRLPSPYKTLKTLVRKTRPVVVVGGANQGGYVDLYRNLWPAPEFHLFEVRDIALNKIRSRYRLDKLVHINNLALSDESAPVRFHVNHYAPTSSVLATNEDSVDYEKRLETVTRLMVEAVALDDYASQRGIEHIDLLKLDIQGGELMALYGASGLLSHRAIGVVQCEVMFSDMYEDSPTFCDLDEYLGQFDYGFYTFVVPATTAEGRLKWLHAIWKCLPAN